MLHWTAYYKCTYFKQADVYNATFFTELAYNSEEMKSKQPATTTRSPWHHIYSTLW